MFSSIRIGLVSDQPIFRTGLSEALRVSENFAVVAHGQTAEDAYRMAADASLDILLLEIEIPGIGTGAVRAICGAKPGTKVVVHAAISSRRSRAPISGKRSRPFTAASTTSRQPCCRACCRTC
jgi:DNA-binding NarL/FixJ family response regulator